MRIRSIKPEFWRSDDIAALPTSARLLFIGLWSYVDDNGVGSDKQASIAADLFAPDLEVDPTETFRRVSEDTACLHERGLIIRYRASGKPLLFITNWERHQVVKNPSKGHLYPLPSADLLSAAESLPRLTVDPTETLGTGTGEQGNRGTGEQTTPKGVVPRKRGTRIPEPFIVNRDMRDWAAREVPTVDVDGATRKFVDHWRATTGRTATKLDWIAAWRNWLRNETDRHPQHKPTKDERALAVLEMGRQLAAREQGKEIMA